MTVYEIFPDIKKLPFFECASNDTVNKYLNESAIKVRSFSHGDIIYSPASESISVGILIEGAAKVRPSGDEKTLLKTMNVGELFGIANLYAEDAAFPSVIAAEKKAKKKTSPEVFSLQQFFSFKNYYFNNYDYYCNNYSYMISVRTCKLRHIPEIHTVPAGKQSQR